MQKPWIVCCAVIVIAAGLIATTAADTADTLRKLTASEIKSKVSGMEIEDVGEHWAEQYMRNGSLKVFALDKLTTGKWRVQNGESLQWLPLCCSARFMRLCRGMARLYSCPITLDSQPS